MTAYTVDRAYDVNRGYAVNGLDQYTAAGPATFAYDANGNLRSDGSNSYVYDAENRLVSATGAAGTVGLSYDPLGRLWQVSGPNGTTRFLYDGDDLIQEFDGIGNLLRAWVHGPGRDEPLMWYEYTNGFSRSFLHADHQGSIVAASDSAGNATAIAGYDAWGIPNQGTVGVQAGGVGRFGYTGQAWIPELGMYHYKARVYSPTLGRFLQTDPVGYEDQMNLYAYVGNDPVNATDPDGMYICNSCSGISTDGFLADPDRRNMGSEVQFAQARPRVSVRYSTGNARMAPFGVRGQQAPGGHPNIHVARTPRQLQERLQRERNLGVASSFRSEAAANHALAAAVRQNQPQINEWVRRGDPFPMKITYTSRTPLGMALYRGQSTPRPAYTATFWLRPIERNVWLARTHDYYVRTGYVE